MYLCLSHNNSFGVLIVSTLLYGLIVKALAVTGLKDLLSRHNGKVLDDNDLLAY